MKKILPLMALVSACTYNTYNVGEEGADQGVEITNCDQLAARDYECNPQKYSDYMNKWGVSIDSQLKQYAHTCSPEKADFFNRGPAFIECMEKNSCEDIKAGICTQYIPAH